MMLQEYISKLDYSSLADDKIRAEKLPFDDLDAFLFYDYLKQLHLIIKSDEYVIENRKGIKIQNSIFNIIDFGKHSFIDISCTHVDFQEEFIQILDQIRDNYENHSGLVKTIKLVINKWYYFFGKDLEATLTESEIKGAIGELLFIKKTSTKLEYKEILDAWSGPQNGLRDFNFKNLDVEVKASSKEIGHVHTINGQLQLKSSKVPLYVFSVSLKRSNSENSMTVTKLIDKICYEIGNDSLLLNVFFEKLEMLGLIVDKTDIYDVYSYEFKNELTVRIDHYNSDFFLLENNSSRISDVKYDYDFNGLENNEIDFNE